MPELPEVEACRYHLEEYCLDGVIVDVRIDEAGGGPRQGLFDDIVFELSSTVNKQSYIDSLFHRKLSGVHRKGKQLWLTFDAAVDASLSRSIKRYEAVLFHFGMTGSLVIKDTFVPVYKSFDVSLHQWPPRFTKLELIIENSAKKRINVSFADPRRLGKICLRDQPTASLPISQLGLDLTRDQSYHLEEISSTILASTRPIKVLLLDQEKVFCGVGNWIADEVLYQAAIHPETKGRNLTHEQIETLVNKLSYIFNHAINCLCKNEDYPSDWLFNYRWDKRNAKSVSGGLRMPDGNKIDFIEVGGRTTAIVPAVFSRAKSVTEGSEKKMKSSTKTGTKEKNSDAGKVSKKRKSDAGLLEKISVDSKLVESATKRRSSKQKL